MLKIATILMLILFQTSFGSYTDTWTALLKDHTKTKEKSGIQTVLVDYKGVKRDPRWNKLLDEVRNVDINNFSTQETKAFWINIYNIGAVKMVIDNHPLKSIKNAGTLLNPVWNKDIIDIQGQSYSLGYIEHKILRKTGDSLIHYAIVCASLSCPDLRREAYLPEILEKQTIEQRELFLANKSKGIYIERDTYYISKLYSWYKDDFGDPYTYLNIPKDKKIKYMKYNWSLNSM